MKKKTQEEFIKDICKKFSVTEDAFQISPYLGWDKPIIFTCLRCFQQKHLKSASYLMKKNQNHQHLCRCYGYDDEWIVQRKNYLEWKER